MLLSAYLPLLLLQLPERDRPNTWWLEYLPPHLHRDKTSTHININSWPTIIKLWKFKLSKLCFSLSFKNISFCFLWNLKWLFNYKRYTILKYIITSLANFFIFLSYRSCVCLLQFLILLLCVYVCVSQSLCFSCAYSLFFFCLFFPILFYLIHFFNF